MKELDPKFNANPKSLHVKIERIKKQEREREREREVGHSKVTGTSAEEYFSSMRLT